MFVVILRFSVNKTLATQFMPGHNDWIRQGFEDGVFLLAGGLQPNAGGVILAHDVTHAELLARVRQDPFVAENVVSADILEIMPGRADARLSFLMD